MWIDINDAGSRELKRLSALAYDRGISAEHRESGDLRGQLGGGVVAFTPIRRV